MSFLLAGYAVIRSLSVRAERKGSVKNSSTFLHLNYLVL